jgi:hypothetical protein
MAGDKKGTDTASGWVQSVAAAREVSAEELRRQAALFRPTPRQTLFRDVAEEQVNMGNMLQTRWLQASKEAFAGRAWKGVSRSEFDTWTLEPGFNDWFYTPIPQVAPLTEQEKQMADQLFLEGLMRGMQSSEDWAFKEYGRFRFGNTTSTGKQATAATGDKAVKDFLAPSTGDAWAKATKAEA